MLLKSVKLSGRKRDDLLHAVFRNTLADTTTFEPHLHNSWHQCTLMHLVPLGSLGTKIEAIEEQVAKLLDRSGHDTGIKFKSCLTFRLATVEKRRFIIKISE